jgi:hypothetical protein
VLAIGFLLVILSAALWKNYYTFLVVLTYVIAPIPNWLCGRAANHDDFMEGGSSGIVDLGRFLTGFFVVMGIGRLLDFPKSRFEDADVEKHCPPSLLIPILSYLRHLP